MIKYIFFDMDGTILDDDGYITDESVKTIKETEIPVTLVSARAPIEMSEVINRLELTEPQIAFNGGLIFQEINQQQKILEEHPLKADVARILIQAIKSEFPKVSVSYYDLTHWYTDEINHGIEVEADIVHLQPDLISVEEVLSDKTEELLKIMLIGETESEILALKEFLENLQISDINIQRSNPLYLEITSKQAKKSHGIDYIIEKENLKKNELAAFGDGHNDLPMFERVAYPIAMDNAPDEVKQHAKFITKSNIQEGISYGIKEYLNKID
ncbi:Cof-type HAD-IIB family hydrolase [Lactobacillus sp. YT155]|uniref:Cof-type HAD-IIB family hydrolase n=1 Tax=Lactobacillus sp. YT155 TaxID=3060955 RepID=UPI00265DC9E5|nr:Cof-type HAD-IIB family hydrolase [Lactobacillus sp. YT155]MDO1604498.1 Cof-type HAD-IIB family hydrolase [Lactobacillus sp. YT155]